MCCSRQCSQDQLQPIRVMVPSYLALMKLELMQSCFNHFDRNALFGNFLEGIEDQGFNRLSVLRLTTLKSTHERHFAVRIFQTAER